MQYSVNAEAGRRLEDKMLCPVAESPKVYQRIKNPFFTPPYKLLLPSFQKPKTNLVSTLDTFKLINA